MITETRGQYIRFMATRESARDDLRSIADDAAREIMQFQDEATAKCMNEDGSWRTVRVGDIKADLAGLGY